MLNFILPAVAGLGSALLGSSAARSAANTAAAASDRAGDVQLQMFRQSREDLAPFREAGYRGLARFEGELGPSFQTSPGYQFALGEGVNAIDRAASARGMLGSGGRLRELTRFGQGMANQEWNNYLNRLASMAGIGQSATTTTTGLGQQAAGNVGNAMMAGGQAQAAGGINSANAILGGANQALGLYAMMNPQQFPGWGNLMRQRTPVVE